NEAFDHLVRHISRAVDEAVGRPLIWPHLMIGSGGTFTTLAAMHMAELRQAGLPVQGHTLTQADVRHTLQRLRKLSPRQRRSEPGLSEDRADIIVAGLAVIDCLMRHLHVNIL